MIRAGVVFLLCVWIVGGITYFFPEGELLSRWYGIPVLITIGILIAWATITALIWDER